MEPIEKKGIRVYDCPLCREILIGTLEEAREHVGMPLSRGVIFPKGFVFGHDYNNKFDKETSTVYVIYDSEQVDSYTLNALTKCSSLGMPRAGRTMNLHDYCYKIEGYKYNSWKKDHPKEDNWDYHEGNYEYSNLFQEDFNEGIYFLLTEEDFEEFKRLRKPPKERFPKRYSPSNKELVRTVEGIEKLFIKNDQAKT